MHALAKLQEECGHAILLLLTLYYYGPSAPCILCSCSCCCRFPPKQVYTPVKKRSLVSPSLSLARQSRKIYEYVFSPCTHRPSRTYLLPSIETRTHEVALIRTEILSNYYIAPGLARLRLYLNYYFLHLIFIASVRQFSRSAKVTGHISRI